jgi:hypothetical protein
MCHAKVTPARLSFCRRAGRPGESRVRTAKCVSASRRMGWTRRPRIVLVPSPLRAGRPDFRPATPCSGRPAWRHTCFPGKSSDGRRPEVPVVAGLRTGREVNRPLPRPHPAGCGSCNHQSPTLMPKWQIGLRSDKRPARRRGWLGVLPQNGARQELRRAVTPCSAKAGERAEV